MLLLKKKKTEVLRFFILLRNFSKIETELAPEIATSKNQTIIRQVATSKNETKSGSQGILSCVC